MIRAVILDFDGTLVDSVKAIWGEYSRVMRLMGLPRVKYRDFTKHLGKTWSEVLTGLWPGLDVEEFNRHYRVEAEEVSPIKGVPEALEELGRMYLLAILTSRGERTMRMHMKTAGIDASLFRVIMHRDNLLAHKPNPQAILETCKKLGVGKDEVVYVGDSVVDAKCARDAGVRFVGVLSGGSDRGGFVGMEADYIIESIAELPGLLRSLR